VRSSLDSTTCAWNHYRNSTSRSTTSWSRCRSPTSTSTSTSLDNRRKTRRQTRLESCLKLSSWNENQYNDTVAVPRRATRSTGRAGPAGAGGGIALPPRSTRSGAELRPRRRRLLCLWDTSDSTVWRGVWNIFPPFGTCLVIGIQRAGRRRSPDGYGLEARTDGPERQRRPSHFPELPERTECI
jgi:hypothetical protein